MAAPKNAYEFWPALAVALDIPPTLMVKKAVIVIDEDDLVYVHLKTLLPEANAKRVVGCFQIDPVADIEAADDCTVKVTPHKPEAA
jgi:hypothetical protein